MHSSTYFKVKQSTNRKIGIVTGFKSNMYSSVSVTSLLTCISLPPPASTAIEEKLWTSFQRDCEKKKKVWRKIKIFHLQGTIRIFLHERRLAYINKNITMPLNCQKHTAYGTLCSACKQTCSLVCVCVCLTENERVKLTPCHCLP